MKPDRANWFADTRSAQADGPAFASEGFVALLRRASFWTMSTVALSGYGDSGDREPMRFATLAHQHSRTPAAQTIAGEAQH